MDVAGATVATRQLVRQIRTVRHTIANSRGEISQFQVLLAACNNNFKIYSVSNKGPSLFPFIEEIQKLGRLVKIKTMSRLNQQFMLKIPQSIFKVGRHSYSLNIVLLTK